MAAERPIVSTPIRDVVEPYGDIIYVGAGPEAFVAACSKALAASPAERDRRKSRARRVLRSTSWDETARRMDDIIHHLADPLPTQEAPAENIYSLRQAVRT
jgi:UDP-galactopyranose mutase